MRDKFKDHYECLDVLEFNRAFDVPISTKSQLPNAEQLALRKRLIEEEFKELMVAIDSGNLAEIAKEAADLRYVVYGLEIVSGIPSGRVWNEVHASNMAKLGPDGKPIRREDGKVIKPANWKKPNIQAILDSCE